MKCRSVKEQKKYIKAYTKAVAWHMFNWFIDEYGIELWTNGRGLKIIVSLDDRRRYSYGGLSDNNFPVINLDLQWCMNFNSRRFTEYPHYAKSKIIGSIKCKTWRQYVNALVAHEISHIFELYSELNFLDFTKSKSKNNKMKKIHRKYGYGKERGESHGRLFQEIYKIFRKRFINNKRGIK
jgi:hypothetical protein